MVRGSVCVACCLSTCAPSGTAGGAPRCARRHPDTDPSSHVVRVRQRQRGEHHHREHQQSIGRRVHAAKDGVDEDPGGRTAELSVAVYPLVARNASAGPLVTVGRDARHDVVIPDPSVSRFHAFAKPAEDGACLLQDMGSTNGTTVNGTSVPARGTGEPMPVKPGDTVCFGQVKFTFSDARALREFVLQATR